MSLFHPWSKPAPPWVVLIGPHGCGKSSVLRELERVCSGPWLAGVRVFYRHPVNITDIKRYDGTVIAHYSSTPRGSVVSVAKLGLRALEWWLGYWGRIIFLRASGYLVIFDRHYLLDLMVDPQRYRYGGPLGLVRALARIMPKPDLVIILDAPVEVLFARKQEAPREQLARLREAYVHLAGELPNGHVVNAAAPLEQVVADVERIILDYVAARSANQLELNEHKR